MFYNIVDMKHNVVLSFFCYKICLRLIVMMMGDGSGQLVTNTQYPNRRCGHSCCCPSTQSALHFLRDILGTIVNIILSDAFISVLELYKSLSWINVFLFWPKASCLTAKDQTVTDFNLQSLPKQARKP